MDKNRIPRIWVSIRNFGPWLLVIWPAYALWVLIAQHAVNTPFLDDFMSVRFLEKASQGTLTWHDFFAAQMEHRIAWTRLVILLFWKFSAGGFYLNQIWFNWTMLCLTLINVWVLMRRSIPLASARLWPLALFASLALFSPVQYQVVLWPFMHQVLGLAFLLTGTFAVWQTRWPLWLRFAVAASGALCASLSFSAGFLIWLTAVPVIWWAAGIATSRCRAVVTACWLLLFALTLALYLPGLKNEVDPEFSLGQGNESTLSRDIAAFLSHPAKSAAYALRVLGGPLARGTTQDLMDTAFAMGLALLTLYGACLGYAIWRFRDAMLRQRLVPWLAVGAYGVGTAASIAMGRVWLTRSGINALSGRYLVHAVPLIISLPSLIWISGNDLRQRHPRLAPGIARTFAAAGAVLIMLELAAWSYGETMMDYWASSRLRGATNLMFYKTGCPLEQDKLGFHDLAKKADDLGLLNPAMLQNSRLDNFRLARSPLNPVFSAWTSLKMEPSAKGLQGVVAGHAVLKKEWRVPDGVFLSYQDRSDGHWQVFHVTQVTALPLYLEGSYSKDLEYTFFPEEGLRESLSSFDARFNVSELPGAGVFTVAAWAFDYRARRVALIPGVFEVDTANGSVKSLGANPAIIRGASRADDGGGKIR